jgi:hypothetical protein
LEYIDISPSSTLIKQYQVCLCNTSHVYILINLFDLCQHFFLHRYIHFFKCWHMLNEPLILSSRIDWSIVSTDRKTYLFSHPSELYYYIKDLWVWRYQRGNQNPHIEEEHTTQWPNEKVQKDKQRSKKNIYIEQKIE